MFAGPGHFPLSRRAVPVWGDRCGQTDGRTDRRVLCLLGVVSKLKPRRAGGPSGDREQSGRATPANAGHGLSGCGSLTTGLACAERGTRWASLQPRAREPSPRQLQSSAPPQTGHPGPERQPAPPLLALCRARLLRAPSPLSAWPPPRRDPRGACSAPSHVHGRPRGPLPPSGAAVNTAVPVSGPWVS